MALALAATPAFVAGTGTATTTTPAFTPATGEILILTMVTEDQGKGYSGTINTTGSTFSAWTQRAVEATTSHCWGRIYSASVTTGGSSSTVAATFGGTTGFHSMCLYRFTTAQLAGTPAVAQTIGAGAPTATVTTVANGSIVVWCNGDWAAVAPGTPAYRSSATQDGVDDRSTTFYVGYHAHQTAASAGAQTIGLTAPTGETYKLLGIEVQDSSSVAVGLPELTMAPRWN